MRIEDNTSVADLHWFYCGSGSSILGQCGSGFGSGTMVMMTELKLKKITAEKIFFYQKLKYIYPKPSNRTSKLRAEAFSA
jgi:hypothetical protein